MSAGKGAGAGDQWSGRHERFVSPPDPPAQRTLLKAKSATGGALSLLSVYNRIETRERIDRPYEQSGWVHACLKPIGQAVASVPLRLWLGDPKVDRGAQPVGRDHPTLGSLVEVLCAPNPAMTGAQFLEAGALHRKLDGEDFWFLLDKDGNPLRESGMRLTVPRWIVCVRGRSVGMKLGANGFPESWRYQVAGSRYVEAPAASVLQFRDYDPDEPLRGLGDVEALLSDIDLEWQATRYQRAVIKHSGDPGGTITMENAQLASDEKEALENEANEEFSVQNAGRWRLLTGKGVKYEPHKLTPRDMDFQKMLAWVRDKIASVTGVPPPVIGVMDNATLQNFAQSVEMFWKGGNGILSYLRGVEDVLNERLLKRLAVPQAANLVARFDTSQVDALREDKSLQYEIAKNLAAANIGLSFDEALRLVGLDGDTSDMPYVGTRLVSAGLVPIERVLEQEEPEEEEPQDDGDEPADQPAGEADDEDEDPDEDPDAEDGDESAEPGDDTDGGKAAGGPDTSTRETEATPEETPPAPPSDPAAERRAYWDAREAKVLQTGEKTLKRVYKGWRRKYEKAVFKRLRTFAATGKALPAHLRATDDDTPSSLVSPGSVTDADLAPLLPKQSEWTLKMEQAFKDPIRRILEDALEDIAEEIGGPIPLTGEDASVLEFLSQQVIKLTEGHTSTLADQVRDALKRGLSQATNSGTLQELVAEVLPAIEEELRGTFSDRLRRADTIARTETAKAANGARFLEMKHEGVTTHVWITSRDSAVRGAPGGPYEDAQFSHHELDGKEVGVGVEFDPDGHPGLKHPGDADAAPGDTINCRCVTAPVVKRSAGGSGEENEP